MIIKKFNFTNIYLNIIKFFMLLTIILYKINYLNLKKLFCTEFICYF